MNRPVACSSVISRTTPSLPAGMRMKRSILPGMRISAFIGLPSEMRVSSRAMGQPRRGMRRVDRERRQQRKDVVEEMILDPRPLALGDIASVDEDDADLGQNAAQVA